MPHASLRLLFLLASLAFASGGGWACVSLPGWVRRYQPSEEVYRTNKHGVRIPSSCEGILLDLYARLHRLDKAYLKELTPRQQKRLRFEQVLRSFYEIETSPSFQATCPDLELSKLGMLFLAELQRLLSFQGLPSFLASWKKPLLPPKRPLFCRPLALFIEEYYEVILKKKRENRKAMEKCRERGIHSVSDCPEYVLYRFCFTKKKYAARFFSGPPFKSPVFSWCTFEEAWSAMERRDS